MNTQDIKNALDLLIGMAEGHAEKVLDFSAKAQDEEGGYEFIGFQTRPRNAIRLKQTPLDDEIMGLFDQMHQALAMRLTGKPSALYWRLKPELIFSGSGVRIGCRVKIVATVTKPKLEIVPNDRAISDATSKDTAAHG